jgi:hypothetical protein
MTAASKWNGLDNAERQALEQAARPLWAALEDLAWVDGHGGSEFERVFPETIDFIHRAANPLPYDEVAGLTDKERELLDALLVMHYEAMDADDPEGPLTVDEVASLRRRLAEGVPS